MVLLGRASLEVIGLLKRTLLPRMGLLGLTELALTSLFEQILLSLMGLPSTNGFNNRFTNIFYNGRIRVTDGITNRHITR